MIENMFGSLSKARPKKLPRLVPNLKIRKKLEKILPEQKKSNDIEFK